MLVLSSTSLIMAMIIGIIAGIASGMFGIGGGVIIVPLLMMLLALPIKTATGTSLVAMLFPFGLLAVWVYYKEQIIGFPHLWLGVAIAAGMLLGAWGGAQIALRLPVFWLQRGFALLMIILAIRLWIKAG